MHIFIITFLLGHHKHRGIIMFKKPASQKSKTSKMSLCIICLLEKKNAPFIWSSMVSSHSLAISTTRKDLFSTCIVVLSFICKQHWRSKLKYSFQRHFQCYFYNCWNTKHAELNEVPQQNNYHFIRSTESRSHLNLYLWHARE